MSAAERVKGRRAEAEVAAIYREHGFTVRGLEGGGDHSVTGYGLLIHSEVKRQERTRLHLWARQAAAEAPRGALPIVAYRANRQPWNAMLPETAMRSLLPNLSSGIHYTLVKLNGEWWAWLSLTDLLEALSCR